MSETIFTKIIAKELPAEILYEDEHALAFNDINPQAPIHFLVIPKKPIATILDMTQDDKELVGHMHFVACEIAREQGFDADGFRTVMNCKEYGGQTVYHIHLHVLAGKPLGWPPYQEKLKVE